MKTFDDELFDFFEFDEVDTGVDEDEVYYELLNKVCNEVGRQK